MKQSYQSSMTGPHKERLLRRSAAIFRSALIVLAIAGTIDYAASRLHELAQSADREKPTVRDFGSSLKRLKWDPEKQSAVEIKSANRKGDTASSDDVVRVETNLVVCDVQVRDKSGRVVEGLNPGDFVVTEDAQPQHLEHFSLGNDQRVGRSIVLLIDY